MEVKERKLIGCDSFGRSLEDFLVWFEPDFDIEPLPIMVKKSLRLLWLGGLQDRRNGYFV